MLEKENNYCDGKKEKRNEMKMNVWSLPSFKKAESKKHPWEV